MTRRPSRTQTRSLSHFPQRFILYRREDVTDVSGTGFVASGVVWPDGHVALRWKADDAATASSTSLWSSVTDVLRVHGHGGRSEIVYLDHDHSPCAPDDRPSDYCQ